MVDGDGGGGLDPQVASSPLQPAVVAGHHLAFPQHWEVDRDERREDKRPVIGLAVHDDGSRGRRSHQDRMRCQQALLDSSRPQSPDDDDV